MKHSQDKTVPQEPFSLPSELWWFLSSSISGSESSLSSSALGGQEPGPAGLRSHQAEGRSQKTPVGAGKHWSSNTASGTARRIIFGFPDPSKTDWFSDGNVKVPEISPCSSNLYFSCSALFRTCEVKAFPLYKQFLDRWTQKPGAIHGSSS